MKVVKFRAWYRKFAQMSGAFNPIFDPMSWKEQDGDVFMQFTGLCDQNGTDIYEGDILTSNVGGVMTDTVVFEEESASFQFKDLSTGFGQLRIDDWQWKVIGNVYENPELLA